MRRVWFIDDRLENRDSWLKGFGSEIRTNCELKTFEDWPGLREDLNNHDYPDVLFLDFFLPDCYGHEIIEWIDLNCPPDQRPVLVAHSSMEAANIGMCENGADCGLEKHKGESVSSSIASHFRLVADIEYLVKNREFSKTT